MDVNIEGYVPGSVCMAVGCEAEATVERPADGAQGHASCVRFCANHDAKSRTEGWLNLKGGRSS